MHKGKTLYQKANETYKKTLKFMNKEGHREQNMFIALYRQTQHHELDDKH